MAKSATHLVPADSNAISYLLAGAKMLATICEQVDEGANLNAALKENFNFALLEHRSGVDQAVDFVEAIKGFIDRCQLIVARVEAEKERAENVLEAFKGETKAILEAHPDIPYRGFRGSIALQKNSSSKLHVAWGDQALTEDIIDHYNVDRDRFVKTTVTYRLDAAAVKEAMEKGEDLPWAIVEHGQHVRFRK